MLTAGHATPNPPFVSVLVPTFARTRTLAETVECFARQTYAGRCELVILNDCSAQTLRCAVPHVRTINCARLSSLGLKRNALTRYAHGELFQYWDDDDIYLPDHIAHGVELLRDNEPASRGWFEWQLRSDGTLTREVSGPLRAVTMRRAAFEALGGFAAIDRDEDIELVHRGIARGWFHGAHHHRSFGPPTVIRRPDTAGPHAETTLDGRAYTAATLAMIASGEEPAGEVIVSPSWRVDYSAMVRNFDKRAAES